MGEIRSRPESVAPTSADPLTGRLEQLRQLFPEAFSEGKVDFDQLRAALGDAVEARPERYSFTWAGKRDAMRILQIPTRATLIPAPDESVNWDTTHHLFIEGDNLEVLKLLLRPYYGRVKMIYIDPPYNTGNDFIYPDNYADPLDTYLRLTGQKDAAGNLLTSNPETSGRYHSAWLSMMYPRLFLARQLLRDDGVIFISIDDHEVHNLRLLMNEVFGEENFVANVVWQKRTSPDARATLGAAHDYVLTYARALDDLKRTFRSLPLSEDRRKEYRNPDNDPRGDWASVDLTGQTGHATPSQYYEIATPAGVRYRPPEGRCWAIAEKTFKELAAQGRIWFGQEGTSRPRLKRYLSEAEGTSAWTWWPRDEVGHNQEATQELADLLSAADVFDNPKPVRLLKRMLELTTGSTEAAVVLDFFAGSCTAAQAVLDLNRGDGGDRRFIMVQLPEPTRSPETSATTPNEEYSPLESVQSAKSADSLRTIADIGKERIRRVISRLQAERAGQLDLRDSGTPEDLGFKVFKLAPSNFRSWFGVAEAEGSEYARQMHLFADPLAEGWTQERVIAEVALKEAGFGLNYRTERVEAVKQQTIFRVVDDERAQRFYICLDDELRLEALRPLELQRDNLFVCRAQALDDEAAANLALQCRLRTM